MKLTHAIMEAEKSCNLLSVSWRPSKVGGVIQSKSQGLNQGSQWCRFQTGSEGPRTGSAESRKRSMSQLKQSGRKKNGEFLLPPPFVLFRPSTDCMMTTHTGEGHLLY